MFSWICFIQFQASFILSHSFNYSVLLHILLGQTACIWAKAEKGSKSITLFALDALAALQRCRGILTGGGSESSPKKKVCRPVLPNIHRFCRMATNFSCQYNSVLLQKAKNTLILCLVLVICTSIVNMQDLRRRPGLEKNLAIVNDQQYYHCANCAFSVSSSCLWSQVVLPPPPKELPALGYK